MAVSSIETNLRKIAFGLGILQGLTYAVLAIICIVLHNQDLREYTGSSYMDAVNANMYSFFLAPGLKATFDMSLGPSTFAGFAWVYLILHLGWVGISVEGLRRSRGVLLPKYLAAWSHLTILICVWDFITVVIMGSDYSKCLDLVGAYTAGQAVCSTGILPVLVIAAKGFVLWDVNLIFAIVLLRLSSKLKKETTHTYHQQHASIPNGFQQQHVAVPQNGFVAQPHRPTPFVMQSPQNVNRNHFEYPVFIPEPDYQQRLQQQNSPRRQY